MRSPRRHLKIDAQNADLMILTSAKEGQLRDHVQCITVEQGADGYEQVNYDNVHGSIQSYIVELGFKSVTGNLEDETFYNPHLVQSKDVAEVCQIWIDGVHQPDQTAGCPT